MKWTGLSLTFILLSTSAASQQAQTAPNVRPFLFSERGNSASNPTNQNVQPGDLRGQLDQLKNSLDGRRGLIEIPEGAPAGWWPDMGSSSVRFLDVRGNSLPDMTGTINSGTIDGFKTGYNNALLLRATETEQAPGNHYTGFTNMQFHYAAEKGGINNFNGTGTKTDYFNVLATSVMRTAGQKTGIASYLSSFSGGDTMGIQSYVTQYGGYDTAGDEQTEGVRVQMQQGSAKSTESGGVFEGIVQSVRGDSLTYVPRFGERTIGEHRILRDLDHVERSGSITSIRNSGGSPNTVTVTGSGTDWSRLGSGVHTQWNDLPIGGGVTRTDLAFCFDPLTNDGFDTCFPVSAIQDDGHLTLNLLGVGTEMNTGWPATWPTAGGYRIYRAAWPSTVDLATHTLLADGISGFAVGDKIDQVLAYNTQIAGQLVALARHIGLPDTGGGLNLLNVGSPKSPSMNFGVAVSGAFDSVIAVQFSNQQSGTPRFFTKLFSDPSSNVLFDSTSVRSPASEVSLWRLRDSAGASHKLLQFDRDRAKACLMDSSLCVSANGAATVSHLDQKEPNQFAGTITIAGSDSGSISFKQPFKSSPACTLTPTADPSEIGAYWVVTTPTSVTARVRRPSRISFNYICVGNPG
jgi:hypothetical protein